MNIRSQFILPHSTNIARDVVTNTMHWLGDGLAPLNLQADEIADRLQAFYNTIYGTNDMMGGYLLPNDCQVLVFDLDDPTPRIPEVRDVVITADTLSTSIVPAEVAIVLSYHAAPESGVPRQRLHNRIYLGGLGNGALVSASFNTPKVSAAARSQIATAATNLAGANTSVLEWVQRSMTPTLTNRSISGGWIDNEPDTQRRRGQDSTDRSLWTA